MGWFRKKSDPIESRVKQLERELEELRGQIDRHTPEEPPAKAHSHFRSSYYPGGTSDPSSPQDPLIFEADDQDTLRQPVKYLQERLDGLSSKSTGLKAKLKELKENVGASPAANPKLLKYLSTGNLEGLQPLRREKRIARNRVLFLTVLLALVLLGLASVVMENR
jgi:cell division protein FtsB